MKYRIYNSEMRNAEKRMSIEIEKVFNYSNIYIIHTLLAS
jgi:hypothetical protein